MRKRKYRTAYFRITDKSERGRRSLVVASQAVGVVAVCRPHRRPNPFVSGQSFHFQMTVALGDALLVPLTLATDLTLFWSLARNPEKNPQKFAEKCRIRRRK